MHTRRTLLFLAPVLLVACDSGGPSAGTNPDDSGPDGYADASPTLDAADSAVGDGDDRDAASSDDAAADDDAASDGETTEPVAVATKVLHRLNRAEYNNTVRDLLGTSQRPADDFPADDVSLGYDNIADTLSVSALHAELALRAAESLIAEALRVPTVPSELSVLEAETHLTASVGGSTGDGWNLWSNGTLTASPRFTHAGRYSLRVLAGGDQVGPDPVLMTLEIDGSLAHQWSVPNPRSAPLYYAVELELSEGLHEVAIGFANDAYDADAGLDRNLIVDHLVVEGPLGLESGTNPARDRILVCAPDGDAWQDCAQRILAAFVTRAWRRPPTDAELESLQVVVERAMRLGQDFETSIGVGLQAVLIAPSFLYRVEYDAGPEAHALDDWALASRLSYFLWSSMPDDELFELAQNGTLHEPEVLGAQVARMLADDRAWALVENFAGQWLQIRNIDTAAPDPWVFAGFDEALRDAMRAETQLFFETFIREPRSMLELLTSEETFVDARLAAFYGVDAPADDGFARVRAPAGRRGLLGQAGILTSTSYPTRSSPVRRGKFVLAQLLCQEPEPPPPGVEGLPAAGEGGGATLRERMEIHRDRPECISCHLAMDPIGFSLEHFDGVGAWRNVYPEGAIDATGTLPDGRSFDGAEELAEVLANDPSYVRCVVTETFTYALGRRIALADRDALGRIEDAFAAGGYTFASLATAIVQSEPFSWRQSEETR